MIRTKITKKSSTEFTVSPVSKELIDCSSFVQYEEEDKAWFVDFNWDNEYETKEEAIRVAKTLVQVAVENKLGL